MGIIGAFLIVLAFVLVIISIIYMLEDDWELALINLLLCLLLVIAGILAIRTDTHKDEKEDDEYVTVVTSDYKVLDQSQMYITNGDTVIHKRYIIKYKK